MDERGKDIVDERSPTNIVSMRCFIDRFGMPVARVVMEATGFFQYYYKRIESRGYDVRLAPPLKLKALTEGRSKTDRNDAEVLAELLMIDVDTSS
jgi:transposase